MGLLVFAVASSLCANNIAEEIPHEETIRELVRQLDAPQRAVRDNAEAKLLEFGAPILPILSKFVPTSAEAKLRWERVRHHLVMQRVDREAEASLVTLIATDVPVEKALRVIEEQSGNRIRVTQSLAQQRVSCSYQNQPFWMVVEDLARQVEGEVVPDAGGTLEMISREKGGERLGVTYHGPFRFVVYAPAPSGESHSKERPANQAGQPSARPVLTLELAWESRLRPALLWWGPIHWQCDGSAAGTGPGASRREIPVVGPRCAVQLVLPIESSCLAATRQRLSGTVEPILPLGIYPFEFTKGDLDRGTAVQQLGQVKVELRSWQRVNSDTQVALRAEFREPQEAFGSHRGWFYQWRAELGARGNSQPADQVEAFWLGDNGVELVYHFRGAEESGGRLTWFVPVAITRATIDFEFDLPREKERAR